MKIFVRAKPNAREEKVEQIGELEYRVSVAAPPKGGAANEAIIKAIASYFGMAPSAVSIKSGFASRNKIVEIRSLK